MIVREWKCRCPGRHRDGFLRHLYATGVAETAAVPGFCGYQILEREMGDEVEVTLATYWESLAAVAAFAGEPLDRAVLYPGDALYAITPETTVRHYRVVDADFHKAGRLAFGSRPDLVGPNGSAVARPGGQGGPDGPGREGDR